MRKIFSASVLVCTLLVLCTGVYSQDTQQRTRRRGFADSTFTAPVFNFEVVPVKITGPDNNRVKIGYAGDGYTKEDLSEFPGQVERAVEYLSAGTPATRPLTRYINFFNIYRIDLVSEESGVSVAARFGQPKKVEVKNALGGTKDEDRLGWVDSRLAQQLFTQAAEKAGIGEFNWHYVVLNNPTYNNSGGREVVFSYNYGRDIALHEAGHGFFSLADEYYGQGQYTRSEPRQVNVTADSTGAKWSHWMGYNDIDTLLGRVGVYEGAVYASKGAYRPSKNSKMGWTSDRKPASFNAVSREKIILDIYDIVRPVDDMADTTKVLTDPENVWVKVVDPDVVKVDWYVNGKLVKEDGGGTLSLNEIGNKKGDYKVRAHVYDEVVKHAFSDNNNPDPLDLVRRDLDKLQEDVNWTVVKTRR